MKKGFLKIFFKDAVRGIIKSVPFGNTITSVVDNIKHERETKDQVDPGSIPHSWISITMQVLGILAIAYAFITKMVTLEDLLKLVGLGQ